MTFVNEMWGFYFIQRREMHCHSLIQLYIPILHSALCARGSRHKFWQKFIWGNVINFSQLFIFVKLLFSKHLFLL